MALSSKEYYDSFFFFFFFSGSWDYQCHILHNSPPLILSAGKTSPVWRRKKKITFSSTGVLLRRRVVIIAAVSLWETSYNPPVQFTRQNYQGLFGKEKKKNGFTMRIFTLKKFRPFLRLMRKKRVLLLCQFYQSSFSFMLYIYDFLFAVCLFVNLSTALGICSISLSFLQQEFKLTSTRNVS